MPQYQALTGLNRFHRLSRWYMTYLSPSILFLKQTNLMYGSVVSPVEAPPFACLSRRNFSNQEGQWQSAKLLGQNNSSVGAFLLSHGIGLVIQMTLAYEHGNKQNRVFYCTSLLEEVKVDYKCFSEMLDKTLHGQFPVPVRGTGRIDIRDIISSTEKHCKSTRL